MLSTISGRKILRAVTTLTPRAAFCAVLLAALAATCTAFAQMEHRNAVVHQQQKTPVARVPGGDPMVLFAGMPDLAKDNLYRAGMDQPQANNMTFQTAPYCREMLRALPKLALDQKLEMNFPSLAPAAANNTFTFLAQRFVASWTLLNCPQLININPPITLTTDPNTGVVTAATIDTKTLNADIESIAGSLDADNAIYAN